MKKLQKLISGFLLLSLFAFSPFISLVSADWPVFQQNPQNSGSDSTETSLKPPLNLLWSLSQVTNAHIVESGNTIYAKSSAGVLYSINANSGAINWQVQTAGGGEIAFANNTIYSGNGTSLDAFNASNGQLIWNYPAYPAGITVSGNVVYFSSGNHAYAVDGTTGNGIWGVGLTYSDSAAPAVANNKVYFGTYQGNMEALNANDGSIAWQAGDGYGNYVGAPDVQNNIVYVGNRSAGWLDAYNGTTGGLIWQYHTRADNNISNTIAYANNKLYTQDEAGIVYGFDVTSGQIIWKYASGSSDNQVPVIVANGVVYQGSSGNKLNALDAQTGALLWQYNTGPITRMIVGNHTLFASSTNGLYALTNAPTLIQAINAGGSTQGNYVTDTEYTNGSSYSSSASVDTSGVTNPAPQAVYQTVRYGNAFSYTIPGLTPGGTYTLRLHFNELYWGTPLAGNAGGTGSRVFNVAINGTQVLSNFDIYDTAGGANKAITEQFPATPDSNGNVTVSFTTVTDNAMVNGIEVYSGTLPSPTPTPTPTPATSALIDAGGQAVGSFAADNSFSGGTSYSSTANVNTSNVTNPAPEAVYQSVRYGNSFAYNIKNLTPNANFTVRLHFNELYWTSAGQRVFNVAINGNQVLSNYDIFADAGGANTAVVKEFTATSDSSGKISLQFTKVTDNAMVNGIEIVQQ